MWDPRSFRLRYFFVIVLAAVLTAGVLRHALHVYGGIPREDIRWEALAAALVAIGATLVIQRVWRR
jgi:hypothetical protein